MKKVDSLIDFPLELASQRVEQLAQLYAIYEPLGKSPFDTGDADLEKFLEHHQR